MSARKKWPPTCRTLRGKYKSPFWTFITREHTSTTGVQIITSADARFDNISIGHGSISGAVVRVTWRRSAMTLYVSPGFFRPAPRKRSGETNGFFRKQLRAEFDRTLSESKAAVGRRTVFAFDRVVLVSFGRAPDARWRVGRGGGWASSRGERISRFCRE